ncbi:TSC22 domain family protein 1-like isoform X2 [Anguilla rostrata]
MAHPAIFTRRGSNPGTGVSALTTVASTSMGNNLVPTDDYQSPVMMQPPPPAGSSSPGPQHPPHSLNLLPQSQLQPANLPPTGAQIKKKSGFQITSVTPAQISVSTNNSIAEDTESYDDLDESHTEDLSSSEILDVSLSRATDLPERSSSEETLSNLHDAETPGTISPNQPRHPLAPPPTHNAMVNGTVPHHHHHHHHGRHHQVPTPHSGAGPPPVAGSGVPVGGASVPATLPCTSGALPSGAQTLPAGAGAVLENACAVGGAGPMTQPPGAPAGAAVGANVSAANPSAGSVSAVSSGLGRTSSSSSSGGLSPSPMTPVPGNGSQNTTQIPQSGGTVSASVAMPTASSGVTGPAGGGQIGATGAPPGPTPSQAPMAAGSRFRVVKLDSSSEPFRKGRWTCMEFYDKESAVAPPPAPPPDATPCSEPESASGSIVSTLSHYSESVGSGETGGPPAQDYGQVSAPGPPPTLAPPQEVMTPLQQPGAAPSPGPGHPQPVSYPQGLQPAPVQVGYPAAQQPAAPPPANPALVLPVTQGGGLPPDFAHHLPVVQPAASGTSHLLPPAPGCVPPAVAQPLPHAQGVALPPMLPGNVPDLTQAPPQQHPPEPPPPAAVAPSQAPPSAAPRPAADPRPRAGPLPPASALYASLPSFTASQLQDAQRLLFQHPALFSLPKLASSEHAVSLAPEDSASALPGSASLFPLKSLPMDGEEGSSSGASVVAIDNKIEQAMDLVKSHLMYAVREEVEVLKEQIKELIERNSQLEQENNLLKNLASPEQLAQFQAQVQSSSPPSSAQPPAPPTSQSAGPSA